MGLTVDVFRSAARGDCTNGGISSRATRLTLVNVDGPFTPDCHAPAALLECHVKGVCRIVPAEWQDGEWRQRKGWHMAGGNYAGTSDSRFSEAVERLTGHPFYGLVAIHDRQE